MILTLPLIKVPFKKMELGSWKNFGNGMLSECLRIHNIRIIEVKVVKPVTTLKSN